MNKAYFHLPGLFEFLTFYKKFLPLFFEHREYFYDWCEIGSIYGAPADCLWGGGRTGYGTADSGEVFSLMEGYNIPARLTFSNSLLNEEHLNDRRCNRLCKLFQDKRNGIIIASDLLLFYIREKYPDYILISSTTKVITNFDEFKRELDRPEFDFVVPDFRLNRRFDEFNRLSKEERDKVEFLVNEGCSFTCNKRKECYEAVSRKSLGENDDFICSSPDAKDGYVFSRAMKSPAFISVRDITEKYLPLGFSQFKIEGRSLGSALLLEFIIYYMTKPEYQLNVREHMYLSNELDLF